ncbi:hypothetical protein DFJ74DRAFT_701479 [Hyaloraphidium curvatum]|nr:hypothetical protein DFJ74DRAFT_701479 [Hyaloraphidium curvatum]
MSLEQYANLLNSYAPTLFKLGSNAALPAWLLLAARPGWKWTERAVALGVGLNAAIYVLAVPSMFAKQEGGEKGNFGSLEGVTTLFKNVSPGGMTAAWLHYVAFDLLTGYAIANDALANGINKIATGFCLFFTLMLGPVGLVGYGAVRLASGAGTKFLPWIKLCYSCGSTIDDGSTKQSEAAKAGQPDMPRDEQRRAAQEALKAEAALAESQGNLAHGERA